MESWVAGFALLLVGTNAEEVEKRASMARVTMHIAER